jgi:phage gp45-like
MYVCSEHREFHGTGLQPGANPTTAIYNASAVKMNNSIGSIVRFECKNMFFYI